MQTHSNEYFLKTGQQGKNRLDILNEIFKESSISLLLKAGVGQGKRILEIGCGTGNMTSWLAEQVGDSGHVYALDFNAEQIKIAKQHATERGLRNITFLQNSISDLPKLNNLPLVDFIYTRFVLTFLNNPFNALELMLLHLKNEGCIVCEEACNSVNFCYPFSPAIHKSRQLFQELAKIKGLEFDLGEKLYDYFFKIKLKDIHAQFIQPIYRSKREKQLIPLTFMEGVDNYIAHSLVDVNEANKITEDLYQCIEDNSYLISFPRTTQIYGKK